MNPQPRNALITLTTDFGLSDTYVGVMKGVILGIAPNARLVDLTHDIGSQNILEASVRLEAALPYFEPGAIHLVVVDPGVGSDRAAMIVRTHRCLFVAPDNGVLTMPLHAHPAIEAVKITAAADPYLHQPVSSTFHGRDVFAPIAAHLALGALPQQFGVPCPLTSLVMLTPPSVEVTENCGGCVLRFPILYQDHFGNVVTALLPEHLSSCREGSAAPGQALEIRIGSRRWNGIVATYAEAEPGAPLAYWGSAGRLEIAIRNGNAAVEMQAKPGDFVSLYLPIN